MTKLIKCFQYRRKPGESDAYDAHLRFECRKDVDSIEWKFHTWIANSQTITSPALVAADQLYNDILHSYADPKCRIILKEFHSNETLPLPELPERTDEAMQIWSHDVIRIIFNHMCENDEDENDRTFANLHNS